MPNKRKSFNPVVFVFLGRGIVGFPSNTSREVTYICFDELREKKQGFIGIIRHFSITLVLFVYTNLHGFDVGRQILHFVSITE